MCEVIYNIISYIDERARFSKVFAISGKSSFIFEINANKKSP